MRELFAQFAEQPQNILRCRFHILDFVQGTRKVARFEQSRSLLTVLMDKRVGLFESFERTVITEFL